jgi:hypothetical protein
MKQIISESALRLPGLELGWVGQGKTLARIRSCKYAVPTLGTDPQL